MPRTQIKIRLAERNVGRLDALAAERGQTRSGVIGHLLDGPASAPDLPSRERALQLLAESAEQGSVTARVALARLLAADHAQTSDSPFDELARRRHAG